MNRPFAENSELVKNLYNILILINTTILLLRKKTIIFINYYTKTMNLNVI